MHCNLKAARRHASRGCFGQFCIAHVHKLLFLHFRSKFWHCHWIQQPKFPKREQLFGIRWRFHDVTLTFDIWAGTFVVHRMSRDQTLYYIWPKSNNLRRVIDHLVIFSHFSSLVKIQRGVGEMSEWWFQAQPRIQSLIYFSDQAATLAGYSSTHFRHKF